MNRRTQLRRLTPLRARTPLLAKSAPARTVAPRKPARDTGPSRLVRSVVLERDGYQCARCGKPAGPGIGPYSLQHRKARGVGGDSSLPNLLLLCGSALTLCHGEVESRDPLKRREDQAKGYRLESYQDPALEPVMYFERPDGPGFTAWLCDNGSLSFEPPGEMAS